MSTHTAPGWFESAQVTLTVPPTVELGAGEENVMLLVGVGVGAGLGVGVGEGVGSPLLTMIETEPVAITVPVVI